MRITILIFLFITINLIAQELSDIDNIVANYPISISSPYDLAKLINRDFKTDEEKARAAYTWIALNIEYDVATYYSKNKSNTYTYSYRNLKEKKAKEKKFRLKLAKKTIKNKKAVCHGYATLYKQVCELIGIQCELISGYAKTTDKDIGKIPRGNNHAWNAVKINNEWKLIDVTWGSGYGNHGKKFIPDFSDAYFFTPPGRFFLKHFPEDPSWLLIKKSKQDFTDLPLFFRDYIKLDIDFIYPRNGILTLSENNIIDFKIKSSIDLSNLTYAFENNRYSKDVILVSEDVSILSEDATKQGFGNQCNNYFRFNILYEENKGDYLTFYYKNKGIVTFKIKN